MRTFIGRTREMAALEAAYASERTEFLPVYGRRRVGKSELLLHFLEGKQGLYFLGKRSTPQLQIEEFLEIAASAFGQPLLAEAKVTDWRRALDLVLKHRPKAGKLVLVLDEFQWTAKASPELPSLLQGICDSNSRGNNDLMLIVCGSYMGFMEREVLGEESPLYGRRTGQILLQPFSFREAAGFHPSLSVSDKAMIHFLCGGIPFYLRFFDPGKSIGMNIRDNFLNEFAALHREVDFLLREELKELGKYHAILTALATGSKSPRQIASLTGIPERSLYYYIEHLIGLRYVAKRCPLTDSVSSRSTRLETRDALFRFWFRFVYPNMSFISQMGPEKSYQELIKPHLSSYWGRCFEHLCREALPALYEAEGVSAGFEIGEYWDKHVQIDLVGLRMDNSTDLGECKWGTASSAGALEKELERKKRLYPNTRNASIRLRAFTRKMPRGVSQASPVSWHALEALYEL
ncbi:MAG: ATP-binding protein [Verrucomicrobia bacterium]|jgi:uncharacterized protein|nr:ATP-binding protein [Verrucomicrobiota bacterium]MBT7066485.1 ATP-binding protein [Verrucomicrobiota bacterium]MBT7698961.1 ATP-binding protein [Verrucomicrobiota bacterium]